MTTTAQPDVTGVPAPASSPRLSGHAAPRRRWRALACLCLSLVLITANNSSLNVNLPVLQRALGSSNSGLQWIVDAYSLVFAGLLLPAGALADRYGRKTALQFGLVVFGGGSFLFGSGDFCLISVPPTRSKMEINFGYRTRGNAVTHL